MKNYQEIGGTERSSALMTAQKTGMSPGQLGQGKSPGGRGVWTDTVKINLPSKERWLF